jgi:hypothetical protein
MSTRELPERNSRMITSRVFCGAQEHTQNSGKVRSQFFLPTQDMFMKRVECMPVMTSYSQRAWQSLLHHNCNPFTTLNPLQTYAHVPKTPDVLAP